MKTKKTRVGIFTSICFVFIMLILLLPVSALAYDSYGPISDFTTYDANGNVAMTYYDIYSGATTGRNDLNEKLLFLQDAVKNRNNFQNWAYLGYEIIKNGGEKVAWWNHNGHGFDANFDTGGDYMDLISQWNNNFKIANSLSAVEAAARSRISDYFVTKLGHREVSSSAIPAIQSWKDDTTDQPVFYTGAFTCDNDIGQRYYNYFGLAFYDFKLSLLADDNLQYSTASDGYDDIKSAAAAGAPGVSYTQTAGSGDSFVVGVTNGNQLPISATQETINESTTTIGNSIENSEQYSFSEMLGASLSFEGKIPAGPTMEVEVYTEFTAEQVFASAYTDTTENSKTVSNTTSVTVPLPPHTQILMKQSDQTFKATTDYDCPVVITYKVAVYSYCGHIYWDGLRTHICYTQDHSLTTFGKDNGSGAMAVENLANRIKYYKLISNYEATYGDGLNWDNIYFANPTPKGPRVTASVNWLKSHMPMSVTGATLTYDYKGLASEVYATEPMYPLAYVIPGIAELTLGYNGYKYVKDIPLTGTDATGTPYFGFDSRYGHWILLDSVGNPITSSPIASLTVDPVSKNTVLKAGTATGSVYIKYIIDENKYTWDKGIFYTTNGDLVDTAIIKVNVVPVYMGGPGAGSPSFLQGNAATGGGWYTLEDGSQLNFGFNVDQVPNKNDFTTYKGRVEVINEGKWRLNGALDLYIQKETVGEAYGSGRLYRWDGSTKNGNGGWVMVAEDARFMIEFSDFDIETEEGLYRANAFGINIYPVPGAEDILPDPGLRGLEGGNIDIKGPQTVISFE